MMETTRDASADSPALTAPVPAQERVIELDVLRGLAIFGILFVNISFFSAPAYLQVLDQKWWAGGGDELSEWLVRFLVEGKFYALFSLLFGLSFTLQMMRAEVRGAPFGSLHVRRMLSLLLIGAAHVILLSQGDILVYYSLFGLLLLAFRRRTDKTLLIWIVICLLLPVVLNGLLFALFEFGMSRPDVASDLIKWKTETLAEFKSSTDQALRVYSQGSFSEIIGQRLQDYVFFSHAFIFGGSNIFAMFLLGLYAGRRKILQNVETHLPLLRKVIRWGLPVGIIGNLGFVVTREISNVVIPSLLTFLQSAFWAVGAPGLCLFYASSVVLLMRRETWRRRLAPLASVGRMALSNYLLQSLICTIVFYGYGLGLYGKVSPTLGILLTVIIFAIQVPISVWWLRRFQFGPAEWLWRSLTYFRWQPMKVRHTVAAKH